MAVRLAAELEVSLRHLDSRVRHCGRFYGQTDLGTPLPDAITVESLLKVLALLPPGTTELACHPGDHDVLDTMYREERGQEVRVLCDPRLPRELEQLGIELISFADLRSRRGWQGDP